MSVKINVTIVAVALTTVFFASPSHSAVVMNQDFSSPPFDNGANVDPIGTIDDTANGGGIWKSTKSSTSTATVFGNPNTSGGLNIQVGGVINGDIGTAISTGIVEVTMDL